MPKVAAPPNDGLPPKVGDPPNCGGPPNVGLPPNVGAPPKAAGLLGVCGCCCGGCWKAPPKPAWATLPPPMVKLPPPEKARVPSELPKVDEPKLDAPWLPNRPEACPAEPKDDTPPNTFLVAPSDDGLDPRPPRKPEVPPPNILVPLPCWSCDCWPKAL